MEDLTRKEECSDKEAIDNLDVCGCSIEDIKDIGNTRIFKIKTQHKVKFLSGQFFMIGDPNFKLKGIEVFRPYSVCTSENECRHLEFAITALDEGNFSKHFKELKEGDKICIKGPYGKFVLDKDKNTTFISGGSGVTPFISMLRTIRDQNLNEKIKATLIYSAKTYDTILFLDELIELNKLKNIKIIICLTQDENNNSKELEINKKRIDEQILKKHIIQNSEIFLCGPKPMMISIREILNSMKISEDKIHQERW